jgi:hypothetical protein
MLATALLLFWFTASTGVCYSFDPKPDISAYELSLILKYAGNSGIIKMDRIMVPKESQSFAPLARHFVPCP